MHHRISERRGYIATRDAMTPFGADEAEPIEFMARAIEAALVQVAACPHALRGAAMALAERIEQEAASADRIVVQNVVHTDLSI